MHKNAISLREAKTVAERTNYLKLSFCRNLLRILFIRPCWITLCCSLCGYIAPSKWFCREYSCWLNHTTPTEPFESGHIHFDEMHIGSPITNSRFALSRSWCLLAKINSMVRYFLCLHPKQGDIKQRTARELEQASF